MFYTCNIGIIGALCKIINYWWVNVVNVSSLLVVVMSPGVIVYTSL